MKCGVCGKLVTGERNYCEVCGVAVLPAPLLSEADIEQYRRTCAISKAEWDRVLHLRAEAEDKKAELSRLTQYIEDRKSEAEKLNREVEGKQETSERLETEIKTQRAEHADWERKIKQAQHELSVLRQQAKEESKREPAAPDAVVPIKSNFCGKCGTKRAPKDIFCGKCGDRLE